MPQMTLAEVARVAGGVLHAPADRVVTGVAALQSAGAEDLSFVANARYLGYLGGTRAAAVLVPEDLVAQLPDEVARIVVPDAHVALYRVLLELHPAPRPEAGIHATAAIAEDAVLGDGVSVGPHAVIGSGARIGSGVRVGAHAVVGQGCAVGDDTILHPHVTLYPGAEVGRRCVVHSGARIGSDGFGFVWVDGGHRKVPQVGGCRIEDDVEVGANACIDRGSVGDTVVGQGTKLDNLVHIAHNVRIGRHAILVGQVGISGSTTVGDGAVLGGQAGVGGHLEVGAGARVGGQAGVIGDVAPGETVSGYPARPHREALRAQANLFRLPQLMQRLRKIEAALFGGDSKQP